MSESPADSTLDTKNVIHEIPIEIVSEEEMALIDAALASTRCSRLSSFSSHFHRNARSIQSITLLPKRRLLGCNRPDIEDFGKLGMTHQKNKVAESYLERFRKKGGLCATDITGTEWCEKKMEFTLLFGKEGVNKWMKVGRARHEELEKEVTRKVKLRVKSIEDKWAVKLINSINGTNQLLFEGLTRELPIQGGSHYQILACGQVAYNIRLSFIEGVWVVGVIDEIQMLVKETDRNPILVDIKTRVRDTLPDEAQRRNGRLQLMCYKYMWDNLAADNFPSMQFYDFFSLNPYYVLSEDIIEITANAGFPAKTLDDIVRCYRNTWNMLPPAHNQLLLRYEFQKDHSLIGEEEFAYDYNWFRSRVQGCLGFWKGEREANFTPVEERWKCHYCQFSSVCHVSFKPESTRTSSQTDSYSTPS